jgi:hypothetical protein
MKAETQIKSIVAQMTPLAEWFVRNQPGARRCMHLRRADWEVLLKHERIARTRGFQIEDGRITYKGFDVEPTDSGHIPGAS